MSKPRKSEEAKPICFVIMPYTSPLDKRYRANHFANVFGNLIEPACTAAGYKCVIEKEERHSRLILINILRRIEEADVILCDLSTNNANVYLELGWVLRQGHKNLVLITDHLTSVKFDVGGLKSSLNYGLEDLEQPRVKEVVAKLSEALKEASLPEVLEHVGTAKTISLIQQSTSGIDTKLSALLDTTKQFLSSFGDSIGHTLDATITRELRNYKEKRGVGMPKLDPDWSVMAIRAVAAAWHSSVHAHKNLLLESLKTSPPHEFAASYILNQLCTNLSEGLRKFFRDEYRFRTCMKAFCSPERVFTIARDAGARTTLASDRASSTEKKGLVVCDNSDFHHFMLSRDNNVFACDTLCLLRNYRNSSVGWRKRYNATMSVP
ncbi:MAG: hypothetical protein RBU21_10705, partial [FCB group bacterium]|nr:hypothetical protein [FCB group bacterium]